MKKEYYNVEAKIKDRHSWFKIIIISLFAVIITIKIFTTDFTISFKDITYTDLLSTILAFFAIGLSVAFYFKATETSNNFYDNTFKFTKEISGLLKSIESGFGEKLNHLDEGYSKLSTKFDSQYSVSRENAKEEIAKEETKLTKMQEDRNKLFETLVKRANLQKEERNKFISDLSNKDEEIKSLERQLDFLKAQVNGSNGSSITISMIEYSHNLLRHIPMLKGMILESPKDIIQRFFKDNIDMMEEEYIRDLMHIGYLDDNLNLTEEGISFLRNIALVEINLKHKNN
ncbi:hypothetical protein SH1V18_15420 [Vallitalea longa]|uniref:Uncharacterized protein n=1 Tax=Vallitalea longa TaxID=2936439 RepID=A0A9W5Y8E1_9FIRM|nr:hypothetical protein [Vallitalea longa]GKX29062.1 hypothetical protein SH1V18_15420 [Vallitalea longa]